MGAIKAMGRGQDPGEIDLLDQRHGAIKIELQRLDPVGRTGRLLRIALHAMAHQPMGVEAGHVAALPDAASAAFIASLTRFYEP